MATSKIWTTKELLFCPSKKRPKQSYWRSTPNRNCRPFMTSKRNLVSDVDGATTQTRNYKQPCHSFSKDKPISSIGLRPSIFSLNLGLVENPLCTHWVYLVEPLNLSNRKQWRIALMMSETYIGITVFGANIGLITHVYVPLSHVKIFPSLGLFSCRFQQPASRHACLQRLNKIPHILDTLDHWQAMEGHQKCRRETFSGAQACLLSCFTALHCYVVYDIKAYHKLQSVLKRSSAFWLLTRGLTLEFKRRSRGAKGMPKAVILRSLGTNC